MFDVIEQHRVPFVNRLAALNFQHGLCNAFQNRRRVVAERMAARFLPSAEVAGVADGPVAGARGSKDAAHGAEPNRPSSASNHVSQQALDKFDELGHPLAVGVLRSVRSCPARAVCVRSVSWFK